MRQGRTAAEETPTFTSSFGRRQCATETLADGLPDKTLVEGAQREPVWKEGKLLHIQAPFILKKALSLLSGAEKVAEGTRQEDRRQHLMQIIADRRRIAGCCSGGNIREERGGPREVSVEERIQEI